MGYPKGAKKVPKYFSGPSLSPPFIPEKKLPLKAIYGPKYANAKSIITRLTPRFAAQKNRREETKRLGSFVD
jgi:hypothetical protein